MIRSPAANCGPFLGLALIAGILGVCAPVAAAQDEALGARVTAKAAASVASPGKLARKNRCARYKGTKLRRCRAIARCKKLKGRKKRKRCLARARKIGLKKKPPQTIAPAAPPQTTVQLLGTRPPPPTCVDAIGFKAENFPSTAKVSNTFLPLIPGTKLILEGRANRGGGPLPHQVTFTITDLTKVINGVRTVVVWDVDRNESEVAEAELSFFAQDRAGNVWNLGEYPEEYEAGLFVGAPNTWIAGQSDAKAGIHMLANPTVAAPGAPWYIQGSAPAIDFLDCATVTQMNQTACVPFKCYDNVLVTNETSPLDVEGAIQSKYHAPQTGIVQVGALNDPEGETLVLVNRYTLSTAGLDRARKEALKLDARGYQNSVDYTHTSRAKRQ